MDWTKVKKNDLYPQMVHIFSCTHYLYFYITDFNSFWVVHHLSISDTKDKAPKLAFE